MCHYHCTTTPLMRCLVQALDGLSSQVMHLLDMELDHGSLSVVGGKLLLQIALTI